jgi:pantothenate kinase-related protein Tda10
MKILSSKDREQWLNRALAGEALEQVQWDILNGGNWGNSLQERLSLLRSVDLPIHPLALWDLWLPLAQAIARKHRPEIVFCQGILGPQGSGKSTLAKGLVPILAQLGLRAVALSLDDFYLTYAERQSIKDPELIHRGPPGTHDVDLAVRTLVSIKEQKRFTWIPRFDKSAYAGKGERWAWPHLPKGAVLVGRIAEDRLDIRFCLWKGQRIALPENPGASLLMPKIGLPDGAFVRIQSAQERGFEIVSAGQSWPIALDIPPSAWELLDQPVDVVLLEGWFVGVKPLISHPELSALAYRSNQRLTNYLPIWKYLDALLILQPEYPGLPLVWRTLAEKQRRMRGFGAMADEKIAQFVDYFDRALPSELFMKPLIEATSNPVITLDRDHLPIDVTISLA